MLRWVYVHGKSVAFASNNVRQLAKMFWIIKKFSMFNEGCQLQLCPRKQALFIKCCPLPSVFNISHESIINGIVTHRKKVLGKHYFKDNAKEINGG